MAGEDAQLTVRLSKAALEALEKIAKETKRTKTELAREAIVAFIGMYRNARKS